MWSRAGFALSLSSLITRSYEPCSPYLNGYDSGRNIMLLHPRMSSAFITSLFIYSTHTIVMLHRLWGRTMVKAASRRSLTAEP